MEAVRIHPLDLFEILARVNSDPVEIRLQRLTLDGEPLLHYQGSEQHVDGVLYEQTTTVPHKTTRFDDELAQEKLCGSAEAGIVCGEPEPAHTVETARGDVGMDHDFIPLESSSAPQSIPAAQQPELTTEPAAPETNEGTHPGLSIARARE